MKRLVWVLLPFLFIYCSEQKEEIQITGSAAGFEDGTEIYLASYENRQTRVFDTLVVSGEKFSGNHPLVSRPQLYLLRVEGMNHTLLYFPENKDLEIELVKDKMDNSSVRGGRQNDAFTEYSKAMRDFNERRSGIVLRLQNAEMDGDTAALAGLQSQNLNLTGEVQEYQKEFLKKNQNSLFSLMVLSELVNEKAITASEASSYLDKISPDLAATDIAAQLIPAVESMKQVDIGVKAPDFSAPTPEGDELSLQDALGKYTLITFWASWCVYCKAEIPAIVEAYNQYHSKGLNIIGVSLDRPGEKDKWIQDIEKNKMDWYHVSNLAFWDDPIAREYRITAIPAAFLLDENGVIIDNNLKGESLKFKLARLFAD